ncbi:MAG: hypothetical protein Kapaf2KO_11400 [Candidatus Kapaibacteriales bacterium]
MLKKLSIILLLFTAISCGYMNAEKKGDDLERDDSMEIFKELNLKAEAGELAVATLGAGCFWCVEAVFDQLEGVEKAVSGYMGGRRPNPTYEQVCTGTTGHAEVINVYYYPDKVTFDEILEIFWTVHDPTTLNRQGNDIGTQYRSAVFYHSEEQKELAEGYKKKLDESGAFSDPIVTEISPATEFYIAEGYHQNYFENNPTQSYCAFVVAPMVEKFQKVFKDKLKK